MDAILTLVSATGFIGSLVLLGWGMVLSLSSTLESGQPAHAGGVIADTHLPQGTPT